MVAINTEFLEKIYESQIAFREVLKLRREILEDYELVDRVYLCLNDSLDSFLEEGLFATTELFDNIYERVTKKYKQYNSLMQGEGDLLGSYESTIYKLREMKIRTNCEIRIRDEFSN